MPGRLYLCATPIGNLEDVTLRLLRVLSEVDVVAAEDTRRTRKLLTHHGIKARLVAYHDANERDQARKLVDRMKGGERVALVTDSGTPAISDPGYRIVQECIEHRIPIEVLPGPSAAMAALTVSGLPTDRFSFEGFLPRKAGEQRRRLKALATDDRTLVFFEAPSRVAETLKAILETLGDRRVALARELTKVHEEVLRTTVSGLMDELAGRELLGECVLVVGGRDRSDDNLPAAVVRAAQILRDGETRSTAARIAAGEFGVLRRAVYEALGDFSAEKGSQG